MFSKILIANRGEIACRIIKSARRMGIATVAVYSEADADALFVRMADEAVAIGAAPAAESYLVIEKIIAAAKQTGTEAIHPGYGFLSEREAFTRALAAEGIAFIGPNPKAIAAMGDKIESKKLASAAGVTTVPGYLGIIETAKEAVTIAKEIGFPVMIKASAGGGGKGMRIANNAEEVEAGFASAVNEARGAFGDDRVFVEKFITSPRHIEIQVLGDKHGNIIHLCERECSIQRRNQKIIEEAPSPFLDEKTRAAMGQQAIELARVVDYDSAGTVEFIVDSDRNFYFLEMNTRLQVEHPVTELITGIDLVEEMIRVAAGEKLRHTQDDIQINGWALEARVYAEDPYRNFLPAIGRIKRYNPPTDKVGNGLTVRNDTGVHEGAEVSIYYDPMIAKLCTHGPTRAAAIHHMIDALNEFDLDGLTHNVPFLAALVAHPRFQEGRLTTGFIAEEYPEGFHGAALSGETKIALACVAVDMELAKQERALSAMYADPFEMLGHQDFSIALDGADYRVSVSHSAGGWQIDFTEPDVGQRVIASDWRPGQTLHRSFIDVKKFAVLVEPAKDGFRLRHAGANLVAYVRQPFVAELAHGMPEKTESDIGKFVLSPMPGLVADVRVVEGQEVKAGEPLAVVEAMKMENVILADRDGTVKKINIEKGASIAVDEIILEFE